MSRIVGSTSRCPVYTMKVPLSRRRSERGFGGGVAPQAKSLSSLTGPKNADERSTLGRCRARAVALRRRRCRRLAPGGGNGKGGESNSLLPQANGFTSLASRDQAAALQSAPWVVAQEDGLAPTGRPREVRTAPPAFHPQARKSGQCSLLECSASGSFNVPAHAGSGTPTLDPLAGCVHTHCLSPPRPLQSAG